VNKAELTKALADYYGGSKAEAARALNAVVETITYKTAAGEKVSITGFGVFEKIDRPARMVRNPRTGERTRAKKTSVPRFRAGSELKAYVSGAKKVPKPTKTAAPPATKTATKTAKVPAAKTATKTATKTAKAPTAKTATKTAKAPTAKTATKTAKAPGKRSARKS
jgi:DNA-binding protein HU-beta